jgi:hypothetical protein
MAIRWKFEYYTTDGSSFISLDEWIATLTQEEQEIYKAADLRQKQYRQEKINEGNLVVLEDSYVWKDSGAEKINKLLDPIWSEYFDRWQQETKSGVRMERQEI